MNLHCPIPISMNIVRVCMCVYVCVCVCVYVCVCVCKCGGKLIIAEIWTGRSSKVIYQRMIAHNIVSNGVRKSYANSWLQQQKLHFHKFKSHHNLRFAPPFSILVLKRKRVFKIERFFSFRGDLSWKGGGTLSLKSYYPSQDLWETTL